MYVVNNNILFLDRRRADLHRMVMFFSEIIEGIFNIFSTYIRLSGTKMTQVVWSRRLDPACELNH
jgi:hypothetical protein